ncbi:bacillithiol biosynthesis deacetylase BshB1 [Parapedobacter sp. ISTM3]|uniref:Bacillithiol biosynthesis deacetylase BshB1 n=1 Tax=Parapedobacter luteus TaxID=623280 RepID=A0A1T5AVZ0_9SPHI|nr:MULTISPECIES: bacillithiol biosynthesis deacetylase BshB1 [Parapedobacter]MBK1440284.1 bacillithiol biosynthesis deacetylase BshB1 [Parapedobacter sp. ISTM3]SKB39136.1 bacillithiol biosynthesis deacetylase BshB1 [Parapedobacter luteus]
MEENNKLDILVVAVHPDDAELGCGGTILKHVAMGRKVGIVDLTRGELGTRGTPESRAAEARRAAELLGLSIRENLGMRDGFFRNDESHQLQVVQTIRKYRPDIVIANALFDRHPDHGRAGDLINDAVFLAGLRKIETTDAGEVQAPHRPRLLLQLIQDYYIKPDIVLDISEYWEGKINAIRAFRSQFHNETYASNEPETYISRPDFLEYIEGRAREYGKYIGAKYAEGFTCRRLLGVDDLFALR